MSNRQISRTFHAIALVALASILLVSSYIIVGLLGQPAPYGPMVQFAAPDALSVVWSPAGAPCEIELLDEHGGNTGRAPTLIRDGQLFTARFPGLARGTRYEYRLSIEGQPIISSVVQTPPRNGESIRILAFGDSGSGTPTQYQLADRMVPFEPDLILHTGDLVYPDGETSDYGDKFFAPYAALISRVPFYPCVGNHDVRTQGGAPMFRIFDLPRNGPAGTTPERHYWFDYGDVRIVALDTNPPNSVLNEQVVPWLQRVLLEAADRFKIVFFHHPVFAGGRHGPTYDLWASIVPLLEEHNVHLVLNGHEHSYQRSHPIRTERIVAPGTGVVYVTTGTGGAALYTTGSRDIEQVAFQYNEQHGFTVIDVQDDSLAIQHVVLDGSVIDSFIIPRCASDETAVAPAAPGGTVENGV